MPPKKRRGIKRKAVIYHFFELSYAVSGVPCVSIAEKM